MKHRRFRCLAVGAAALAVLAAPAAARADAVTDWSMYAQTAIIGTGPPPTAHASVLTFAMVQGAVYDAVNGIDGGHRPYLVKPVATPFDSKAAAAATAAYRVLVTLYPGQMTTLKSHWDASIALATATDGLVATNRGIAAGEEAAAAMLNKRANDGRGGPFTFVFGTTPGVWRLGPQALPGLPPGQPVDPTPWVGNVTPFLVPNVGMLRTDGPNPLTSRAYAKDLNEVKSLGSLKSTRRTADQTMAAIFWQAQPGGLWGDVMRSLSASRGLNIADNARLFAMVDLAQADASIGCWNDKYYWNFWRPIDAIRQAASDGNPATEADPGWLPLFDPETPTSPLLVSPGFPDHPSGHSCISSASVHTLQNFFGTDKIAVSFTSPRFPGQSRSFDRFSRVLKEIIDARVWGGIHFRTADVQGAVLGKKVARWEQKNYFQSLRDHDHDDDKGGGDGDD
jgi:hypothetical protein